MAVLREAVDQYLANRVKRLSAGLAFYTLFALVPSLLLAIGVAGAFVGREAAAGELADRMEGVLGDGAAERLEDSIAALWASTDRSSFAVVGVLAVLYSASVLFVAWRDTVELIWDVPYQPGIRTTLLARALAALVPVLAGVALAAAIVLQSLLTFVASEVGSRLVDVTVRTASALVQSTVAVLALMVLFRYSARGTRPARRDVLPAAVLVVVVLDVGYWAYGLYLRYIGSSSVAGAASGAFLGLLVVQATAQVLLFGAVIIDVLRRRRDELDTTELDAAGGDMTGGDAAGGDANGGETNGGDATDRDATGGETTGAAADPG